MQTDERDIATAVADVEQPIAIQSPPKRRWSNDRLVTLLSQSGTIITLLLLIGLFSALRPQGFPTVQNLVNMLNQASVLAIIAGGLTLVLILGEFDLSISFVATLSGVLVASLLNEGTPIASAIALTLMVAIGIGILNGILVAYVKINAFIATLGTGAIVGGLVLWVSNGGEAQSLSKGPQAFLNLGQAKIVGIPVPVFIGVAALLVLWFLINKTEVGRRIDATGGSREASRLSGISVNRYLLLGFVISGLCAGIGGILLAAELGGGFANSGESFLLQSYTACFLGAVTLRQNEFHIIGTAVGVAILVVTFTGLAQLAVPVYWQNIAQGAVLILAVSITVFADRLQMALAQRKRVISARREASEASEGGGSQPVLP
jgi:ribose transport system permease protein